MKRPHGHMHREILALDIRRTDISREVQEVGFRKVVIAPYDIEVCKRMRG
jgi:hypothetical protein